MWPAPWTWYARPVTVADRLRSPDPEERLAGIAALVDRGSAGSGELAALAECLGHARKAVQRPAAQAFAALAARGAPVRGVLLAALESPLARQRWGAAFALSLLGELPAQALAVVLEALGAPDGDLRWAAADIVVRMKNLPGLADALRGLLRAGNAAQQKMALYCLRDLAVTSHELEEEIVAALGGADRDVRLAAIACLARLSSDRAAAAEHLIGALEGDDERARRAAAAGLGRLGERSERVIAALRRAGAGGDVALRRAAERALRQLGAAP